MSKLFGTDGVRGVANKELTPELALALGHAGARWFLATFGDAPGFIVGQDASPEGRGAPGGAIGLGPVITGGMVTITPAPQRPFVVVGRDSRLSGTMLEGATAAGICSAGVDVVSLGLCPTGAVAYLARVTGAVGGIMISASHNPPEDNGIKFFTGEGYKLSDDSEDEIEATVAALGMKGESASNGKDVTIKAERPDGSAVGVIINQEALVGHYVDYIRDIVPSKLGGIKVVVDCANGAASDIAPALFTSLGAEVSVVNNRPNGININVNSGSTHPDFLAEAVRKLGADLGIAFDGDADRLIVVDDNGGILDGDHLMAFCARGLAARGDLPRQSVVATVMSNLGLERAINDIGGQLVRCKVGDRYVLETMRAEGITLGGEQSGHIIFLRHGTTGDGLLTAAFLLGLLAETGGTMCTVREAMIPVPQVLINTSVAAASKETVLSDPGVISEIEAVETELGGQGRLLVRPSGTQPVIRVMLEGDDDSLIKALAQRLVAYIKSNFGPR